jgi:hypothetical protein
LGAVVHGRSGDQPLLGKSGGMADLPWMLRANLTLPPLGCPALGPSLSIPGFPGAFTSGGSFSWVGNGVGRSLVDAAEQRSA